MTKPVAGFAVLVVAVTLLVIAGGMPMAGEAGHGAVTAGALLGGVFQLFTFVLLVMLLPGKLMLASGLGMLGRFVMVALAALLVVPVAGVPAAPMLLALVSVLVCTAVLEPVFFALAAKRPETR